MTVVPLAGTWIETYAGPERQLPEAVVPLAGTWIETLCLAFRSLGNLTSFPLRERGLKPREGKLWPLAVIVVPLAGTWIETPFCDYNIT